MPKGLLHLQKQPQKALNSRARVDAKSPLPGPRFGADRVFLRLDRVPEILVLCPLCVLLVNSETRSRPPQPGISFPSSHLRPPEAVFPISSRYHRTQRVPFVGRFKCPALPQQVNKSPNPT